MKTDKRSVLRLLPKVREQVLREIRCNAAGGGFAAGLSSEGYAGGYAEALSDVEAALTHGHPSDQRGYWSAAQRTARKD